MPTRRPSGGRGSNQYQQKSGGIVAGERDLDAEDVAAAFDPDAGIWLGCQFTGTEQRQWRDAGISCLDALEARWAGLTPDQYNAMDEDWRTALSWWVPAGYVGQDLVDWTSTGWSLGTCDQWKAQGRTAQEANAAYSLGHMVYPADVDGYPRRLTPARALKESRRAEREWAAVDLPVTFPSALWRVAGFTVATREAWLDRVAEAAVTREGYTAAVAAIEQQRMIEPAVWKDHPETYGRLHSADMRLHRNEMRRVPEAAAAVFAHMDANQVDWHTAESAITAPWSTVDPQNPSRAAASWMEDGISDPIEARRWVDIGVHPGAYPMVRDSGTTAEQMVPWRDVTDHRQMIPACIQAGVTPAGLASVPFP